MLASWVMTIIGRDRPGLVDQLAGVVAQHGGNWLESRMSRLGGQFAGILRIQVPPAGESALAAALTGLEEQGLKIIVYPDPTGGEPPAPTLATLKLVGHDRPGIVRQISSALARQGVNVEELVTGCESAPMTGESLFRAHAELRLPPTCDTTALQAELERIAGDLMVDLTFRPADHCSER